MTFEEMLGQAIAMLQRRGRLTYRTLKRQFQLEVDALATLLTEDMTFRLPQAEAAQDRQGKERPDAVPPMSV